MAYPRVGVSGERLEVDPVSQNKSGFFGRPAKPTTYSIKRICACEVLEERSGQKTVFRIVRSSKDGGFKNIDFEAPTSEASKTHTTTTTVIQNPPFNNETSEPRVVQV
jgi:hypothetical protein